MNKKFALLKNIDSNQFTIRKLVLETGHIYLLPFLEGITAEKYDEKKWQFIGIVEWYAIDL